MDFRISEWPINRVVSTENLDIAYSTLAVIQQLARIFELAVFTLRIRIFYLCMDLTKLDNACIKCGYET